jgi:lysozyme
MPGGPLFKWRDRTTFVRYKTFSRTFDSNWFHMPRYGLVLILLLFAAASCTTSDLGLELEASPSRYGDSDPQHFGDRHPATHEVHGIDVSKWQGNIDWDQLRRHDVAFA